MQLIIGDKKYSSWSLRAWFILKALKVDFTEVEIRLNQPETQKNILKYSPSGKVPALIDGDIFMWDSLSIGEYLNEKYPKAQLWPADKNLRAFARSCCAEMHSGFLNLRNELPTNFQARKSGVVPSPKAQLEIERAIEILSLAQKKSNSTTWLLGEFTLMDAFFMPVVNRFYTYFVPLPNTIQDYVHFILSHPWYQEWCSPKNSPLEG